jgi:hypothetical protein
LDVKGGGNKPPHTNLPGLAVRLCQSVIIFLWLDARNCKNTKYHQSICDQLIQIMSCDKELMKDIVTVYENIILHIQTPSSF